MNGADSRPIHTSLPARCLDKGEKLLAFMTVSGELTALSYDLSQVCLACHIPSSSQMSPYADMDDHSKSAEPLLQCFVKLAKLVIGTAHLPPN